MSYHNSDLERVLSAKVDVGPAQVSLAYNGLVIIYKRGMKNLLVAVHYPIPDTTLL